MFAYCNNNPIMYKDSTGYVVSLAVIAGSAAGGAVAGAMISAVSYTVNQGLNGEAINTADLLEATLIGAASGAAGGLIGLSSKTIKLTGSAVVGIITGGYSLCTGENLINSAIIATTTMAATYFGTKLDTNKLKAAEILVVNYSTTLFTGTLAEITSVGARQKTKPLENKNISPNINHSDNYYHQQQSLKEKLYHGL